MEINIDMSGVDALARKFDTTPQVIADEMENTMWASVKAVEQAIGTRTPVGATGNLRRIKGNVGGQSLEGTLEGTVLFEEPYAPYVEDGRAPGRMPPPDALAYWALRKPATLPGETPEQAGWRLAMSIAKKGTKAAHMVKDGWAASRNTVIDLWKTIDRRIAQRIEDKLK